MSLSSSSSRHSTASSTSVDLNSYQDALEGVLTWLLEAEDVLCRQREVASDVNKVKEQFQIHEVRDIDLWGWCSSLTVYGTSLHSETFKLQLTLGV